jgi:hypothetical protein
MEKEEKPEVSKMAEKEEETPAISKMEEEEKPEVSKMAAEEEPKEGIQTKPLLMRKTQNGASVGTSTLAAQLNSSKGSGQSLPKDTNRSMSRSFGTDFSGVRIHNDHQATEMNQGLNARAFTHGSDIYFNQGEYSPGSSEGKRLLAHELTHVVQQGGTAKSVQKEDKAPAQTSNSPTPSSKSETKIEGKLVVETDFKKVTAKTTQKSSEPLTDNVTKTTEQEVAGDKTTTKAGVEVEPNDNVSVSGSVGAEQESATGKTMGQPIFESSVEVQAKPFTWLGFKGGASLSYQVQNTPAVSVDGKMVFLPKRIIAPYIFAAVNTGDEKAKFGAGATLNLPNGISIDAKALMSLDFDGKKGFGAAVGVTTPLPEILK